MHAAAAVLLTVDEIMFKGASPPFAPTRSVNDEPAPAKAAVVSNMIEATIVMVSFLDISFLRSALGFDESRSTERARRRLFVESSLTA
ncbi:hypothetical protein DBT54_09845 [Aerococcus loyolae]|uniref:Uncharacterized protein n=1 Tax=Aerococcus urinae TaxID=1376 RepID=A0A329NU28_9LACT|nr:hypothetical protein DBT54_09845 [Aerococcus loyolae]